MKLLFLLAIVAVLGACGVPKQGATAETGPDSNKASESSSDIVVVQYESKMISQETVELQIRVGEKTFDVRVHAQSGLESMNGYGAILTDEDRQALSKAAESYAKAEEAQESADPEKKALYTAIDYLSDAPANYVFGAKEFKSISLEGRY